MCRVRQDKRCLRRAIIPQPKAAEATPRAHTTGVGMAEATADIVAIADHLTAVRRQEDHLGAAAATRRRPRMALALLAAVAITGVRARMAARDRPGVVAPTEVVVRMAGVVVLMEAIANA
jgi:hypothetical protein